MMEHMDEHPLAAELFTQNWAQAEAESPRGRLLFASCRSGDGMASSVAERYQRRVADAGGEIEVPLLPGVDFQFSDMETGARLDRDVSGYDVFLFQALRDPTSTRSVDENLMAFLVAARALRQWGASHVTAVLPYLAYSRQDKPTQFEREPTTARLVADLIREAGVDRLVTWHPHSGRLRGFYGGMPVDALEPVALFAQVFARFAGRDDVIAVAPDAGASKLITYVSRTLNLRAAVTSKVRLQREQAHVADIMGDFDGRRIALVFDDMIGTGGTLYEVVKQLVEQKGVEEVHVGVSHNLCLESARARLLEMHHHYGLQEVVVTNSIPQAESFLSLPFLSVVDISDTLGGVINSIHYNRALSEPFYRDALRQPGVPQVEAEPAPALDIDTDLEPTPPEEEEEVTRSSDLSFPASDPPSWTGSSSG